MKLFLPPLLKGLLLIGLLTLFSFQGHSQNGNSVKPETVDSWLIQIENIEKNAEIFITDKQQLTLMQEKLQKLIVEIETYKQELIPRQTELQSQIDKLGPAPAKDGPPEADAIIEERTRLDRDFNKVDAAIKRAGVATTKANQLISRIQNLRRDVFARQLFLRQTLIYSPEVWSNLGDDLSASASQLTEIIDEWRLTSAPVSRVISLVSGLLMLFIILSFVCNRLIQKFRRVGNDDEPMFFHQAVSAVSVSLLRMVPGFVFLGGVYAGLYLLGAMTVPMSRLLGSLIFFIGLVIVVASLSKSILAPTRPIWRMLPIIDKDAKRLVLLITGLAFVYALNRFGVVLVKLINATSVVGLLISLVTLVLFTILLVKILRISLGVKSEGMEDQPSHILWPTWLKLPLWGVCFTLIFAIPLGYLSFAEFLAGQVVLTGAIVLTAVLIHFAITELKSDIADDKSTIGRWMGQQLLISSDGRSKISFAVGLALNLLLLIIAMPLVMLNWGFGSADISSWMSTVFYGFEIGSIRFSLASILIAVSLFSIGILLTRFLQRWLNQGILNSSRIQSGLSNSIHTGVGYLGFLLSLLIAVSYVGLNFTNLAIVAGALSVGIGFGLQSIVNNFVSGLILLVERPVKVGDWVNVGDQEGYVRRISVRSTEIETFDRSSVIVPNSQLITGVVTNWTHGNSVGRIIVRVGVAYESDPRQVYDLLMEIAKSHPRSLTYPAPKIVFEDFGASSLDFSLRIYVENINQFLDVATDLRMTIFETFKTHNIEIAFPQIDVHMKGRPLPHEVDMGELT